MPTSFQIRLQQRFIEEVLMASIEALLHGDGRRRVGAPTKAVEISGPIWGHRFNMGDEQIITVSRCAVSLSAKRTFDGCENADDAFETLHSIVTHFDAQLEMLGDFHSHPEEVDEVTVEKKSLHQFSKPDFESFIDDGLLWEMAGNTPLMIVTTVCKRASNPIPTPLKRASNIIALDVGGFRCWFSAVVGLPRRRHTKNVDDRVRLEIEVKG